LLTVLNKTYHKLPADEQGDTPTRLGDVCENNSRKSRPVNKQPENEIVNTSQCKLSNKKGLVRSQTTVTEVF